MAWALLGAGSAAAQSLDLGVSSRDLYAGLPFVLTVTAQGFEEPEPEAPELEIEGCEVRYLGVSPNVSQRVTIVNGRRTETRRVSFTYRYRITAPQAGTYTVPALSVAQGDLEASSPPGTFVVKEVATTPDMRVELDLPERQVWVGETFEVTLDWLLRRDFEDYEFVVPLFEHDAVQVQSPPHGGRRTVRFPAAELEVELPFEQDRVEVDGQPFTRVRFRARVTVSRPGVLELDPVQVAARLETGQRRDTFGFRVPSYELFKAEGEPQRLSVRPLPVQGRPDSFANAIGTAYSISVQANRTVVQVGDPMELRIVVRGDGPLEGLSLPALEGEGGLPTELFSVPQEPAVGELTEDGRIKTFDVTVRVKSEEAREIPPLAFSYFDPQAGAYRTVYSEPIALAVAGSAVVGAEDVTSAHAARPTAGPRPAAGAATGATTAGFATLVGADLSLSPEGSTRRSVASVRDVAPWLALLYALPVVVLGVRVWQVRTSERRLRRGALRRAEDAVERALDEAEPARDAAPRILAELRTLARLTGHEAALRDRVVAELDTVAFDPAGAERPLPEALRDDVRRLARGWAESARGADDRPRRAGTGKALLLLLAGAGLGGVAPAPARAAEATLESARDVYQAALAEPDRVRRTRLFAEAERSLRTLAATGDRPELLTDWGNAALGAQDVGHAVLGYRRALRLEPTHERALENLAWVRARMPDWLPRPSATGAFDSLFFWHHTLSVTERTLIGGVAFAVGVLLLVPWSPRRRSTWRRLAAVALLVWLATTASAVLEPDPTREAVLLTDGVVLRSADSLGAPPALSRPLPAGTELRVDERRGPWTRVVLADGTRGWLSSGTVETVAPRG